MKCEVCNAGPQDGKTVLIRQNRKGEIGVWRCHEHNRKSVPKDVACVISAIREDVTLETIPETTT